MGPVGRLEPNEWGLHDVLGNAAEWVYGVYAEYPEGTPENPAVDPFPQVGWLEIARGGSYTQPAWQCRLARRSAHPAANRYPGFRVVLTRP